VLVRHPGASN